MRINMLATMNASALRCRECDSQLQILEGGVGNRLRGCGGDLTWWERRG